MDVSISGVHATYVAGVCMVVWWVAGTLAHPPSLAGRRGHSSGLALAPGFQLSARVETAAEAEALAQDQPHTLQPFLACWSYTQGLWQLG